MDKPDKDGIQGEGDRFSARKYDKHVREFIADGKVPDAANEAKAYVEKNPGDAAKSEEKAKRGPRTHRFVSLDDIVAKGQTVLQRVRPLVERTAEKLRARFRK